MTRKKPQSQSFSESQDPSCGLSWEEGQKNKCFPNFPCRLLTWGLFYEIELAIVYFSSRVCVCVCVCLSSQAPAICLQMEYYQATLKLWPSTFISPCLAATTARVSMFTNLGNEPAPELVWDLLRRTHETLKAHTTLV